MNLLHYNAEDVIYGDYMMEGYDQDLLEQLLAYLTVDNMRLTLVAQGGYYDRVAAWYDTLIPSHHLRLNKLKAGLMLVLMQSYYCPSIIFICAKNLSHYRLKQAQNYRRN